MSTPEGEKGIPEWHLFDRLSELEDITLKLMEKADTTEPTLKETTALARDAFMLAILAFGSSFAADAIKAGNPRALKDRDIATFKKLGVSEETLKDVEEILVHICEELEKKLK